jgi:3-hydroxyacyl-CoA dehydrogenase
MSKNFPAPAKCVDAVEAATKKKFADGMAVEREIFINLMWTPGDASSLRHLFTGRTCGQRRSPMSLQTQRSALLIAAIAVIGAGTMGGGIAMNFLNAGIPVKMLEMKQEALDRGSRHHSQELRSPGQEGQAQAGQVRPTHGPAVHHAEL